jgi:protease IV
LILFPFRYLWWLVARLRSRLGKPPDYVMFVLEEDLPALPDPPRPLWQRFTSRPRLSIKELGERFNVIARNPQIKGVVLHLRASGMPMSTREDLRELVDNLRKAGKRVVAWAPFYTTGAYYLACACDEILLMPSGNVAALGFSTTGMFMADGLRTIGLGADFVQISPYKSAPDILTKSKMSDEYRDQVTWLVESQYRELIGAIVEGRSLDESGARALIDGSPYGDRQAYEERVVDGLVAEEKLPDHLSRHFGRAATIATWEQAKASLQVPRPRFRRGRYVAVIRIEGTLVDGRSGQLPVKPPIEVPLFGEDRAGDLTVVQAARQIAADKRAAATVVYVNSRGGSSTASEAIRQAIEVIAARKPVVVVMGPAAASGGYWVSTAGSWIVARPSTLTGSIGVWSGKLVTGGVWTKLLFNRETIALGEHATMLSDDRPFTEEERKIVRREIERIYAYFLNLVAKARKMRADQVVPVAEGKVWTGRQALDRKLVDEMGGLDAGIRKAREMARLSDDAVVREVRSPKRMVPPRSEAATAAGWLGFLVDGVKLLSRAPALAVMEYLPGEPL